MAEETYKSWNIKGIAESVLEEMKEHEADFDSELDYYLKRAYWSVYSKEPKDATIVEDLVKQHIEELDLEPSERGKQV